MPENTINPIALLLRHRRSAIVAALVVLALTVLSLAISEKEYESEAKLQVQVGRESIALDPTATIGPFVGIADSREMEIQAIQELILSRNVLGKVVDQIGLERLAGTPKPWSVTPSSAAWIDDYNLNPLRVYDHRAKAVRKLQQDLDLDIPRNSKIISLRYLSDDPTLARDVLHTLIETTIDEQINVHANDESRRFFAAEAEQLHARVMECEETLAKEKQATGISSVTEQRRLLLEQIARYDDEVAHAAARSTSLRREIEVRTEQLERLARTETKTEVTGTANNPEFEMQVELFRLEIREKELAAKFTDENEQLRQVREQLQLARAALAKATQTRQVTQGTNEERARYEVALFEKQAEQAELESRLALLRNDLTATRTDLVALDNQSRRIRDLERELDLADSAYKKYKESLEIARIDQKRLQERISNLRIMQAPTFSEQPVSPKVLIHVLLGVCLAVLAAFGAALWRDRTHTTIAVAGVVGRELSVGSLDTGRTVRRETLTARLP
jgi:uncharacterized protein involved in exopolysaccharide biosynthesis